MFSALVFGQKEPLRQIYDYSGKNDMALVKAKTDLYWLNVLDSKKFRIHQNSAGADHLDFNLIMPFAKGEVSSRVRYDFLKQGYVVSLSNTKLIDLQKKVIVIDGSSAAHQKIIANLSNLVFDIYQKHINQ